MKNIIEESGKFITIIGSTKYEKEMKRLATELINKGNFVHYPQKMENVDIDKMLDAFKMCINASDCVVWYIKDNYIGNHTLMDLEHVIKRQLPIHIYNESHII